MMPKAEQDYDITNVFIKGLGCDLATNTSYIMLGWEAKGIGSGELILRQVLLPTVIASNLVYTWVADTENMSRKFVKAVLVKIAADYREEE